MIIKKKNFIFNSEYYFLHQTFIIIIMNLTADQSCSHTVFISNKHAEKSEKSKNSCLNLLYIYCSFSVVCNNYLTSAASIFLDLSFLNFC